MENEKHSVYAMIIISAIIFCCFCLTLGLYLGSTDPYYDDYNGIDFIGSGISFYIFTALYIVFSLAFGIWILVKDWKNNKINEGSVKILWGVFSIVLLGLIASFIFGLIALHYYKKANWKPQYSNNNMYYQDPNNMYPNPNNNSNKYDNIQKIHDLYKNGVITEEEYLKMKKDLLAN